MPLIEFYFNKIRFIIATGKYHIIIPTFNFKHISFKVF